MLLKNKKIEQMSLLLIQLQAFANSQFQLYSDENQAQPAVMQQRQIATLNFLSAAVQVVPVQLCCDLATAITKLIDRSVDNKVKKTAYLTLEVLYASRRLTQSGDHIEVIIRHLLENPELPEAASAAGSQDQEQTQRIVAYIQAVGQIVLNLCSVQASSQQQANQQILRYMTFTFSVLSEYLVGEGERVQRAAFNAIRLLLQHGLQPKFFKEDQSAKPIKGKSKRDQNILELLKFSELSLNEEVKNMRVDGSKLLSWRDKLIIHMLYLLTSRFQGVFDLVLRIVQTFVEKVGAEINES
jgi:hypothetical protein